MKKLMRPFLNPVLGLLFGLCAAHPALAEVFQNHTDGNTAVAIINSGPVDITTRTQLIREAKSVEVLAFIQSAFGDIGPHTVLALQEAVQNGAKVRTFYDQFGTFAESFSSNDEFAKILMSPETISSGNAPELYRLSPTTKMKLGLGVDDFFHEKILILDRGLPSEVIVIGTKNNSGFTMETIESSAYIRRLDPTKPYIGDDLKAYADRVFDFAKQNMSALPAAGSAKKTIAKVKARLKGLIQTPEETTLHEQILQWAKMPTSELPSSTYDFVFYPQEIQLFSNDLIAQVLKKFPGMGFGERRKRLQKNMVPLENELASDTVMAVSTAILETSEGTIASYLCAFPPLLLKSIIESVRAGSKLDIFTNGESALKKTVPVLGQVANAISSEQLEMMFATTVAAKGKLQVFGLDSNAAQALTKEGARDSRTFLHRKWARLGKDLVFLGSDNMTDSASLNNNEIMLRMKDNRMADFMEAQMRTEARFFAPIHGSTVQRTMKARGMVERFVDWVVRPLVRRTF